MILSYCRNLQKFDAYKNMRFTILI